MDHLMNTLLVVALVTIVWLIREARRRASLLDKATSRLTAIDGRVEDLEAWVQETEDEEKSVVGRLEIYGERLAVVEHRAATLKNRVNIFDRHISSADTLARRTVGVRKLVKGELPEDVETTQEAGRLDAVERRQVNAEVTVRELSARLGTDLSCLDGRVRGLEATNEETVKRLDAHDVAAGRGFWRTTRGDLMRIRDLGTAHLMNVLDGGFGGEIVRGLIADELFRRQVDDGYHQATMKTLELSEDERAAAARELAQNASGHKNALGAVDGPTDIPAGIRDYIRNVLSEHGHDPEPEEEGA